jgi:hypothetical protein
MNNWEKLTYKILGLRPIKKEPIRPPWLVKSPSDILNVYGTKYLVIR